jgi:hypothetical protein
MLDRTVRDRVRQRRLAHRRRPDPPTWTDSLSGDAVFDELLDQGAPEDGIEERVQLADQGLHRPRRPRATPEDRGDLDGAEEMTAVIGQLGSRPSRSDGAGDAELVGNVEGNDADRIRSDRQRESRDHDNTSESRPDVQAAVYSIGSRTNTGICRSVFAWYFA